MWLEHEVIVADKEGDYFKSFMPLKSAANPYPKEFQLSRAEGFQSCNRRQSVIAWALPLRDAIRQAELRIMSGQGVNPTLMIVTVISSRPRRDVGNLLLQVPRHEFCSKTRQLSAWTNPIDSLDSI